MANETNEQKRERTSPRTTAFTQAVEACLAAQKKGGSIDDCIEGIKALIGTKVEPPAYAGTNYVAVLASGQRISFKSSARPSLRSHSKQFQKAFGPWKKADDAVYLACLNGDDTEAPIVFEVVPQA